MERPQLKILLQRIENEPKRFIQAIYGPRQVGKTTMVLQLLQQTQLPHHYATADGVTSDPGTWIAQQWEVARLRMSTGNLADFVLVLDEIQKIGQWSEQVKREWDQDTRLNRQIRLVILGSSRWLLQKGLTESLAGRFEATYMPHWGYAEMKEEFGLTPEEYIWFGGYPGAAALRHDERRWKEYMLSSLIETSISRDILMLTRVDKPALMKQLFEIGCSYSGQILSFNKILGQLQDAGNTTTLSHYLELLDQAGLLAGLQKYSRDIARQRSSSPKYQVHNTGLMSALAPERFGEIWQDPARWGRWVESAVGAHLINQCQEHRLGLYYWRHRQDEIDFVLTGQGRVVGIEVKSVAGSSTSGMGAFQSQFNPDRVLLVGPSGLPVEEFLEMDMRLLLH
jgi:predicted AAA+ superfamily ATPase